MLPAFDSWRTGGSDGKPDVGAIKGTIDWMFDEFRRTWKEVTAKRPRPLSPGQRRVHETGIGMIADYVLQDGRRLGTRRVTSLDTAFVDSLFAKLLYKVVNGEKVERRTTCNHAFKTARNAWNTISRANPGMFPLKNPFEKMGLIAGDTRETPHATFEQLMTFRAKAIELGYPSLATAAMMGWELLQRKAHIFIRFDVKHYRPADRPQPHLRYQLENRHRRMGAAVRRQRRSALSDADQGAGRDQGQAADRRTDAAPGRHRPLVGRQGRAARLRLSVNAARSSTLLVCLRSSTPMANPRN